MRRVLGLAVVLVALAASPAAAGPIIDDADATELANQLVDASEEQGICYGWYAGIDDRGVWLEDVGSNLGPGVPIDDTCERFIELRLSYSWTPESSEADDRVSFFVRSNVPNAPDEADLRRIGINGAQLLSADDDLAVYNAVLALPALAAERGIAPPILLEEHTVELPASDRPDPEGSDWLREWGWAAASCGIVVLVGVLWLVYETLLRPLQQQHTWRGHD